MADPKFEEAIINTFRERAIRTAHIIDDAFPTYEELAKNGRSKVDSPELDLAIGLYALFRQHHIPCDVDNSVSSIPDVERIRKSDLIVLDYHLGPGDTKTSVSLVRDLSRTKHFNTVILYTSADDLDEVWLNLAVGLRGGWGDQSPVGSTEGAEELSNLGDKGVELNAPSRELMGAAALGHNLGKAAPADIAIYNEIFDQHGVPAGLRGDVIAALVYREVRNFLKDDQASLDAKPQNVDGGCKKGRPRWLQSGNCFVTIMGKRFEDGKPVTAARLFDTLDKALCEWRPNILQIIMSQIQNVLEQDAIATDELQLRDPHTQLSLCYFLLLALSDGEAGRTEQALAAPIQVLLDKLVEGVRQKIVADVDLSKLGGDLLLSEIKRLAVPSAFADYGAKQKKLFKHARDMADGVGDADASTALMRLNAFLSTEPFRGRVTTGTVFSDGAAFWICMSPACDMVDREPSKGQLWASALHPTRPIIAVALKAIDRKTALKHAEDVRTVFLKLGNSIEAFDVLPTKGGPSYEFLFLENGSKIVSDETSFTFQAARLKARTEKSHPLPELVSLNLKVVAQIRPTYASRFLQETGQWLSRIGVDFVRGGNDLT